MRRGYGGVPIAIPNACLATCAGTGLRENEEGGSWNSE